MTPAEYATLVIRSPRTIARWRHDGIGPQPIYIAGRPRYKRAEVTAYLEGLEAQRDDQAEAV